MTLRVLDPGLFTLVVDLGRPHHRSLGVPLGGAADRTALALGNALVGNPPGAAALEVSLAGPTLEAGCDLACVVYGAPFDLASNRQRLTAGKTFTLTGGERLEVGGTPQGMRAYLCIRGGVQTDVVLGSRSALEPLRAGAEVPCLAGMIHRRFLPPDAEEALDVAWRAGRRGEAVIRVLPGPQADWFPTAALAGGFKVTPASNRMGLRLRGEPLPFPERELVSEPVCPGAVQVTRDGQCILLGVDGQTIGGYPKIAQVVSADLDLLGQLRPGDHVAVVHVTLEEAESAYREKRRRLSEWLTRLQAAELFAPAPLGAAR